MRGKGMRATVILLISFGVVPVDGAPQPGQKQPEIPPVAASKPSETEAAAKAPAPVDPKTYVIGAEDILVVRVWREPDLSGTVAVRPDGKMTLPLVGEVQAAGLTPEKLQESVTEALLKFMNRPQVMVSVQSVQSKKYYISGEINKPGSFPMVVPTRVLEALSHAGGFKDFANTKKIVILRGSERLKFNYKEVVEGKNTKQNIFLESGDHIIVP